jgi:hypothetical protein
MKIKHGLSHELIEMAVGVIKKANIKNNIDDFNIMINSFPVHLKNDLYYKMYKNDLKIIKFFKDLPPDIITILGQALTPILYTKGKLDELS